MIDESLQKIKVSIERDSNLFRDEYIDYRNSQILYITVFATMYFALFFWVLQSVRVSHYQIVGICLIILFLWFIYYFIFYIILSYRKINSTIKANLPSYLDLKQKTRDELRRELNKFDPILQTMGGPLAVMHFIMFVCLCIITIFPFIFLEISFNIFERHMIIMVLLFFIVGLYFFTHLFFSGSVKFMSRYEMTVEKRYLSNQKSADILKSKKFQNIIVWITNFLMSIPTLICLLSTFYLLLLYYSSFNFALEILIVLVVVQLISSVLMQKYSKIYTYMTLAKQIYRSLYDLLERVEKEENSNVNKITKEYDDILLRKFKIS